MSYDTSKPYVGAVTYDILLATDVLLKGVWETVAELKDPELRRLASALPGTVLQSRADSTTNKYLYAFQ